jgi:hypothetical protein
LPRPCWSAAGTGGYLYAQRESEAAVERMFDPTFTAAGVSHKPGRYSLLSDRWELDDLTAETLPQQPKGLRIAHLSIAGLDPLGLRSALPGVGNAVPTMIATGIEVEAKPEVHADIERLEISGVDPRSAHGHRAQNHQGGRRCEYRAHRRRRPRARIRAALGRASVG